MTAIADEAHRQNRKVAVHAFTPTSIQIAIDAGVDSIEHGNGVTDAQLKQMRDKGIFFDLTPTWFDGLLDEDSRDERTVPCLSSDMGEGTHLSGDDMTFVGLFETYPNADAYIATFTQLMQIVTRLNVKVIIAEGDNAPFSWKLVTTAPAPATTLVSGMAQTRNGKITRAQSAFDAVLRCDFAGPQDTAAASALTSNMPAGA